MASGTSTTPHRDLDLIAGPGAVAVPPALLAATIRATMALLGGGSAVPPSILPLTRGVANAMIVQKLKLAGSAALSAAVVLVAAVGHVSGRGQDPAPSPATKGAPGPAPRAGANRPEAPTDSVPDGGGTPPAGRVPSPLEAMYGQMRGPVAAPGGGMSTPADALTQRLVGALNDQQAAFNGLNAAFLKAASDGQILVVGLDDQRTFRAMSLPSGVWREYAAPAGSQAVIGFVDRSVAALAYAGPGVREVAVFDEHLGGAEDNPQAGMAGRMAPSLGAWSRKALRAPSAGDVVPVQLGEGLRLAARGQFPTQAGPIVYRVGNDVYVYAAGGQWSDLHVEGDAPIVMQAAPGAILVRQGAAVHVYSIAARRWIRDGEKPPVPGPRPEAKRGVRQ